MQELNAGDCTFASTFKKIVRSECGFYQETGTFRPPKGHEFIVLLLGNVKKGSVDADLVEMLAELGFVHDAASAQQILDLKDMVKELESRLEPLAQLEADAYNASVAGTSS